MRLLHIPTGTYCKHSLDNRSMSKHRQAFYLGAIVLFDSELYNSSYVNDQLLDELTQKDFEFVLNNNVRICLWYPKTYSYDFIERGEQTLSSDCRFIYTQDDKYSVLSDFELVP